MIALYERSAEMNPFSSKFDAWQAGKCQLTEEVYLNENLISEIERKWLKTSAFLVFTEIQLPEYFASVASAIKIIEIILIILKQIFKVRLGI